ncbi:hypothetical protein OPV22_008380 [Ensete ventricosum]|uniref:Trichome birefringence-like N-terminal domain-containing protein n=1 Tax=Ensete ventricosum TaxID=4639 RepID=A0AAV8R2S6_ENSVE|nr:hypothetical protein OPV22_008380 [Ensete ventricosum]
MKPHLSTSNSSMFAKRVRLSPCLLTLLAFMALVAVLSGEDFIFSFIRLSPEPDQLLSRSGSRREKLPFAIGEREGDCDIYRGRWVRDESTRPHYQESDCPYIQPQLTCQEHGRPDKEYQFWRWQPRDCDLPSFNATLMLEALRGKRVMFVGDSLNRVNGSLRVFRAKEYNATIEFYWAPFLLESNSDDAVIHRLADRIVRKGSIDKHGQNWKGADVLVFNTYLWWMTGLTMKILQGQGSFNDEAGDIVQPSTEDAYRIAMRSMLEWVDQNVDPKKTRVFFATMSPSHEKSRDWGAEPGGNCYNQTTMIEDPTYWGSDCRKSIMEVVRDVVGGTKLPITVLNITQLSSYRKDAHTSIYKKQWVPPTPQQIANPVSYADCVHWCLPGLQDTWNELLFTELFYP